MSGSLPDSISNLKLLSQVELRACNFSGSIPSSMANLTQLVYLDFSSNNFSGTIPSFERSRNLTLLNFYSNTLTGEIPSSLWEGLDSLTFLDLGENSLSGRIPASLFSLPSLEVLYLSGNQFSGRVGELTDVYSSRLGSLDLSRNNLEGPIPQFFFEFHNLASLQLSHSKFSGIVDLINFTKLDSLSSLDLSYSNLSVVISSTDPVLSQLPQFTHLFLISCNMQTFPPIRNQSKLMMLDLSNNQITGVVPNWLWDAGDGFLRFLNLSHNKFTHLKEPYRFPVRLNFLDLHSNMLDRELPLPPSAAFYVDFSSNSFSNAIPTDMGNRLSNASYFSIANNEVTGSIPLSLCNASRLEVLDLSNNSLVGTIPACLMKGINNLVVLNLRRNNISGHIPEPSLDTCGLETLDLSCNQIEGQVPESLANCTKIKVLNLGNNKIADRFPCGLKKLPNLRVIVVRSNSFQGNVSCIRESDTWPNLQIIDLASNNFSGVLPLESTSNLKAMMVDQKEANSQLDHLHFISLATDKVYYQDSVTLVLKGEHQDLKKILSVFTSIDFSSNHFQGAIPGSLGDLKLLYLLNLSHNNLTGQIPHSIRNLQQLGSLDLSFSKLVGEIPEEIASLTFLAFLNLSYNQLFGRIPAGNQIQTFLGSSFEGNEGLCGFPLNRTCHNASEPEPPLEPVEPEVNVETGIYASAALGFVVGLGVTLGPIFYSRRYNKYYNEKIDWLVSKILRQKNRREWK